MAKTMKGAAGCNNRVDSLTVSRSYNIGTDFEISMMGVAKEIIKVLHGDVDASKYIEHVADRKINDLRCWFIVC